MQLAARSFIRLNPKWRDCARGWLESQVPVVFHTVALIRFEALGGADERFGVGAPLVFNKNWIRENVEKRYKIFFSNIGGPREKPIVAKRAKAFKREGERIVRISSKSRAGGSGDVALRCLFEVESAGALGYGPSGW